ncbi:MAG: MFS transporter [Actinomycetota bacterium]
MTAPAATHRSRLPLWVAVAAGGAVTAVSLGVRSTFGILLEPIADGLDTGTGSIAIAIAVQNLMWGVSQPIAGAISDRWGAARTLAGGGVLYMAAMLLMSTANSPGMILLSGGFIAGMATGAASFAVALSAVGRMAPPERRSFMLGLVSAIGSLGQFVLVPISSWHLERNEWQDTAVLLAVVLIVIVVVAPAIMSSPIVRSGSVGAVEEPARPLRAELRRARHDRSYLMLNAAFFVCGFHVTYIGVFLPGYAEDAGISATTASTALALIGLFNVFGSLTVGLLGQHVAFTHVLAGIYGLRAVVIAAYLLVPISAASTIVFSCAIGLLWLATVPMTSAIVTQKFGPTHAGTLFGIVFLSHQLGSFLGASMGGELVDATGSYASMWWISVGIGGFAMVLHLLIDESPAAEPPPPGEASLPVVPAGAAAVFLVAGIASVGDARMLDRADDVAVPVEAEGDPVWVRQLAYCPLGGVHVN